MQTGQGLLSSVHYYLDIHKLPPDLPNLEIEESILNRPHNNCFYLRNRCSGPSPVESGSLFTEIFISKLNLRKIHHYVPELIGV